MTLWSNFGRWRARFDTAALARYRQARNLVLTERARRGIAARLRARVANPPPVRLRMVKDARYGWDALLYRDGGGVVVDLPDSNMPSMSIKAVALGTAYLYWLLHCPPDTEPMAVTLSDGDRPGAHRFSPSSNMPGAIAIPDPYFFDSNGFADARLHASQHALPWSERSTGLVWRGVNSGHGTFDPLLASAHPQRTAPRMQLCLALRGVTGTDVAISAVNGAEVSHQVLREHGVGRPHIAEASWAARKFAIDIDGWSNTWTNLIIRMHFGCCVLKVESHLGYRQWYYDRLRPWEHYVPVRSDLSDLLERIDWVHSNDAEAGAIAERGRALAQSLTFDSVKDEAVALISSPRGVQTAP